MRNVPAALALTGTLLLGGAAGAAILQPAIANAASSTAVPSAAVAGSSTVTTPSGSPTAPSTTTPPSTGSQPSTGLQPSTGSLPAAGNGTMPGRGHGFGNPGETVSDLSVAAKAIGISEADLQSALDNGQTVAAVAKAHDVATQTVIDALVQDGLDELAADVTSGRLTQAQADAQKAAVTRRATDQVNGRFAGGPGSCPAH